MMYALPSTERTPPNDAQLVPSYPAQEIPPMLSPDTVVVGLAFVPRLFSKVIPGLPPVVATPPGRFCP